MAMKAETSVAEMTPISEVMTKNPICIGAGLAIHEVAKVLLARGISGAPVIDEMGKPIGVVSKTDLVREHSRSPETNGNHPRSTARDIMTPVAFTLPAGAPISQAAALMAFEGIHRLPVVSQSGEVVGIVSSIDVLRWIAEREGYLLSNREIRRATAED
jgi:CBS domain-containing protein